MKNYLYDYNGMNARELADLIIGREEEYVSANVDSLSFEEKGRWLLKHRREYHPLSLVLERRKYCRVLKEVRTEALRKAEDNDPFALLFLAAYIGRDDELPESRVEYLKRAMNEGSAEAKMFWAYQRMEKHREESFHVLDELLWDILWEMSNSEDEKQEPQEAEREGETLFMCYKLLSQCSPDENDYDLNKNFADNFALKQVLKGNYYALNHLCVKNANKQVKRRDGALFDDETLFWKTVAFLVDSFFYGRGASWLVSSLGVKLMRGIGCEKDVEGAKRMFIDAMLRKSYDRLFLLDLVGVERKGDVEEIYSAERACRKRIANGDTSGYWQLILIGLLKGSRADVEKACDEALKSADGRGGFNIPSAYQMLLRAC